MRNQYTTITIWLIGLLIIASCQKKPTDYRSFLNGEERTYPGIVSGATALPGNGRLMLTWHPNPDPSVARYVVYWNNYADSIVVNATTHKPQDTVKTIINSLAEYIYTFFIISYDAVGNKSITTEINNAKVYGNIYRANLHNRLPDQSNPFVVKDDGSVILNFLQPDTVNITTVIKYTNAAGQVQQVNLAPDAQTITLPSYKPGASILYQSSYVPLRNAIDTFKTLTADTFPQVFRLVQCDKSFFREMKLSNDVGAYGESPLSKLWDGSVGPQSYPNIFHSDGSKDMPQTFSFDMGKVYNNLNTVEITGRDCCHNPDNFEIWGIADTTGAVQTLPSQNAGWRNETIAKGWTLLLEAVRTDDQAKAPMKFVLKNTPAPIRFIRMRVLHVASGSTNSSNLSEITFWDKQ